MVVEIFSKKSSCQESITWIIINFAQKNAEVAQSVEQGTENPRVGGSIPSLGTRKFKGLLHKDASPFFVGKYMVSIGQGTSYFRG
jgi:hypothetical protein